MILYHKQPNSLIYNYVELTLLTNEVNIEWNHYKENLRTKNPKHPLKGNVLAVIYKILHLCMCACLICTYTLHFSIQTYFKIPVDESDKSSI